MWLHVDGAYGAIAALAVPDKFTGLDRADSLSLDPHKWLYQPIDCGCLLYRDQRTARETFSHSGDYVKVFEQDPVEAFAFFDETMELTRRFRALKLWMSLQYHGRRAFREAIAQDLNHAQLLAELVRSQPDLELLAPVPLSAVCFRHRTKDNAAILARVIARGRVYISNATIDGRFALRACFVNHRTTHDDVAAIISEVIAAAGDTIGDHSLRQVDGLERVEAVAGTGIVLQRLAAQMPDDAPDRVEAGLHRALDPARCPGYAIACHEDALLVGRHLVLHEVTIHAVVIAVVARQRSLEGAEEIRDPTPTKR